MIQTIVCIILLGDISSGIPGRSPIQISTQAILRRPQGFKFAIKGHRMNERFERSTTSVGGRAEICEVNESHILLPTDIPGLPHLPVTARVCRTPAAHPLLGEGYECRQDYLSFSGPESGIGQYMVPSGCSLYAVDSLPGLAEWRPLAGFQAGVQDLELSSGLQIDAEHRSCESMGQNRGNHRLDGWDYICEQQHLTINTGIVSTLLPSGCVCYHLSSL